MVNLLEINQAKHIFIYAVCGRSSSTALQRILNSSNEIFMFGEYHLTIEKLVDCYFHLAEIDHQKQANELTRLIDCFKQNKHTAFYANATYDMSLLQQQIKEEIVKLLTVPEKLSYSRVGYKEIGTTSLQSLENLKLFFPNCYFIFLFRNPLKQWGSVGYLKSFWQYSQKLSYFLEEYSRIAQIYLSTSWENTFFLENTSLRDENKINQALHLLEISAFDQSLLDRTISTTNKHKISLVDQMRIRASTAYRLYEKMQSLELKI